MKWFNLAAIAVMVGLLSGCGVHSVDTGHEGIKVQWGNVVGEPLGPGGPYFVNPLTTSIHQMDTRILKWDASTTAYTKDVQTAKIDFTLNYNLMPSAVGTVYKTVGEDWQNKLVGQYVHQHMQDIIGQWDAVDLISNRQQATNAIQKALTDDLLARGVQVQGFTLTRIMYSPEFNNAVEAKVIAQQSALAAQNKTEQIKQEANQTVIAAQAEAQSMQIRAQALERNAKLVEWEAVQKWNGQLPVYMLGGNTPFLVTAPK